MQGPSHLMLSWFLADANGLDDANERRIVAWAGLAPDVDVVAYIGAIVWYGFDKDLAFENVWQVVHHRYTHGLTFVLLTGCVAWLLAARFAAARRTAGDAVSRTGAPAWRVAVLAMLASALHNFCDIVGGGPTWPIYPLWPLSDIGWTANWSWTLSEWPNTVILFACLAATMLYARFAGRSPLELFGMRTDRWFVGIVQRGSDRTEAAAGTSQRLRLLIWAAVVIAAIALLAPLGFRPGA